MKVLSDFDGVMTDQTDEGVFELNIFKERLADFEVLSADEVSALVARAEKELEENPTQHGWWSKGRVSAYADEDLFIKVIGVAVCLDQWAESGVSEAAALREALPEADFKSFEEVSNWSYGEMVRHTRSGDIEPMDPAVGDVIRYLLNSGADVVVVSNSATDRVMELLRTVDLNPVAHTDDSSARFRVRGNARKFELADESEGFELHGFRFDVARPPYRKILTEEVPDVVIGDVFSLDLALPLYLSRTMPEQFNRPNILLRTRHYTPDWSKAICTRSDEENARLGLLEEFVDLPEAIDR